MIGEDPAKRLAWLRTDCDAVRALLAQMPESWLLERSELADRIEEHEREIAALAAQAMDRKDFAVWLAAMRTLRPGESIDVPARFIEPAPEPTPDDTLLADLDEAAQVAP